MQTDRVLLVTPDVALADAFVPLVPTAHVEVITTCDAARPKLTRDLCVVIADARHVREGGHDFERLLESATALLGEATTFVLTAAACPEPIERRIAISGLVHLRQGISVEALAELVRQRLPINAPAPQPVAVSPAVPAVQDQRPELSTRFETNSPLFRRMIDDVAIAAAHNVTILLIGETGSGKTHLSRLIHDASPRRDAPFIHVACGALPRELIESELFGHVKGAFTSAHADKEGKFLAAGEGTILLDEIDVLGLEQQVKLLRVIETREFEPVGSNRTYTSRARLVVASNLDLKPLVEQGRFRPDLYYRLSMLKFDLPSLRQRRGDVVPLARRFIDRFAAQHGIAIVEVEQSFLDLLQSYPWPGNVRELEHVIQRSVIYCRDGRLTVSQLPAHILAGDAGPGNDPSIRLGMEAIGDGPTLERQVARTEKDLIEEALLRNNFSRTNTARELGISRVTLYNKMKRHQLMP